MSATAEFQTLRVEPVNNNSTRGVKVTNYAIPNNVSHINSSNNEDENLIKSKREAMLTIITPGLSPDTGEKFFEESPAKVETRSCRSGVKAVMSSRVTELLMISLIVVYISLVVANLVLNDGQYISNQDVMRAEHTLKYIELGILCTFILEILLKVYAFGIKGYYKDCWYLIDTVIVLITFAVTIVDIQIDAKGINGAANINALFRVFRIILLVRKANEFTRITTSKIKTSGINLKSPVERIIEMLDTLKSNIKDKSLKNEIDWAIQIIANNRLYDPIFESSDDKSPDKNGAGVWHKSYTRAAASTKFTDLPVAVKLHTRDASRRRSLLNTNIKRHSTFQLASCSVSSAETNTILEKEINNLSFDVFNFKKVCKEDELIHMCTYLFHCNNLFEALSIDETVFYNFIKKIQSGYHPNPYHNSLHASDVVQTVNYFLTTGGFLDKADLNSIDIAAMFLSAAIHDFDHPGSNNAYQVSTSSMYALRYNDKAVLENHHVSASFGLLQEDSYNIFANFSKTDYKHIRERMISMVLATDMSTHFIDIAKLKGRLAADFSVKDKDKNCTMDLIVHAADISNPAKTWEPCREWTNRITQEFFNQGDQERSKNLPITHLCDKYTVNISKSQIGFIDFVVSPLLTLIREILPAIDITHLETNKAKWKDLIEHYDLELVALNKKKDEEIQKMIG